MEWFRFYNDVRSDNKIKTLADSEFRVWVNLLCLASDQPDGARGCVSIEDRFVVAAEVANADEALLDATLVKLTRLHIVSIEDDAVHFLKWDKRQFASDNSTSRVQKHREKNSKQESHVTFDRVNTNETFQEQLVTPPDNRVQSTEKDATTTPREAREPETTEESDHTFSEAIDYVLPLLGRTQLKGTEGPQIQTALAQVGHDLSRFKKLVDELAQRNPAKVRSFGYFVARFAEEAEDRQARASPRQKSARKPPPYKPVEDVSL